MLCTGCGTAIQESARFCSQCGKPTEAACSGCGAELAADAKFCSNCGRAAGEVQAEQSVPESTPEQGLERYIPKELLERLEAARSSGGMSGERRIITMLFCDVKGSTAAAAQLDPEEWAEIMNDAFGHLIPPVYRYEGTLARLMGDAILAFFGAPIGHEDDPQRAILAGLAIVSEIGPFKQAIKRKWGVDFDVRVGINTGLVVVGDIGSDMRLEYTAMGDAVNLASRMEQTAAPGTVQISEETYKLVAPLFDCDDLGEIEVKGKEPIRAYRVVRPKIEPGRLRGVEGLESPLVGRDTEFGALRGCVESVRRGIGQIVSLIGEAGLGKSRLLTELYNTLNSEGNLTDIAWLEGRSLSYMGGTPYAPVADLMRRAFGISETGVDDDGYKKIHIAITELDPALADRWAPYLAHLLGIAMEGEASDRVRFLDPQRLHAKINETVLAYFDFLASKNPVVLIFEDIHWADPSSISLITELMNVAERTSLMLVALFRPRRHEGSWQFHESAARDRSHRYVEISLQPLPEDQSRELVGHLLKIEGLPEKLRSKILAKAEGNPFFVEEVIRSLIDQGAIEHDGEHWRATLEIDRISVPDGVRGVLNARLDSLDEGSRQVAQTAAVLGREFDFDTLASLFEPTEALEEGLVELQQRGLIREKSRVPNRIYSFKHGMTQEAAYESMLIKRRREMNKRTAQVIARIDPSRINEIAYHYMEAREAGDALPFVIESGERAAADYATPEATDYFTKAIEITETHRDASMARRAYEGLGQTQLLKFDAGGAIQTWTAMAAYAEKSGDAEMQVSALNKLGLVQALFVGEVEAGTATLTKAGDLAEGANSKEGLAEGCMYRCSIYTSVGDFDEAFHYLDRAAKIGADLNAEEPLLYGKTHIANTMVFMTAYDKAWPRIKDALEEAESRGNLKYVSELKSLALPSYLLRNGEVEAAVETAREAVTIAARIGASASECQGLVFQGQVATSQGRYERAITCNEAAVATARATGMSYLQGMALCTLGTSYLQVSASLYDKAQEAHNEALASLEWPLGTAMAASTFCEVGYCALELGKDDEAGELFAKGLRSHSGTMFLFRPPLLLGSAVVSLNKGDFLAAEEQVASAHDFVEERGMAHMRPLVALINGNVRAGGGKYDEALAAFDLAVELAQPMSFLPTIWRAHDGAARVHAAMGNEVEAKSRRDSAIMVINEISSMFENKELREHFLAKSLAKLG